MFSILIMVLVFAFVAGVLAIVGYALYACTPLPHRVNPYRDSGTGRRRWTSPHLDDPRRDLD